MSPKSDLERVVERDKYEESFPKTAEARLALALAIDQFPGFTLPDPLKRCTRCGDHAAFYHSDADKYTEEEAWYCHVCGPRVSAFTIGMSDTDLRVIAANVALAEQESDD